LEFIIPEHDQGALSLPASSPQERSAQAAERMARLADADPEQLSTARAFLAGYHPWVFDAITAAVEPCRDAEADAVDEEPFCLLCNAPVGIFLAHGPDYRHYRGVVTATSKPRPYKADHKPRIGWRPARDVIPAAS
jgi:hypothetical protein